MSTAIPLDDTNARLNYVNYLNLVGYVVNTAVVFGAAPVFGFPDNAELSNKYQTVITPTGFTFAIWGLIFAFEGIFTVVQLTPRGRADSLVQKGVNLYFFFACLFQAAWVFLFGYEFIILSTVAMGLILLSLLAVLFSQARTETDLTKGEFWFLSFPFMLHCGWIFSAFALNVNVLLVDFEVGATGQTVAAFVSLGYFVGITLYSLFGMKRAQYTIPSVFVWTILGIFLELREPIEKITDLFSDSMLGTIKWSAVGVGGLIVFTILFSVTYRLFCVKKERSYHRDDDSMV